MRRQDSKRRGDAATRRYGDTATNRLVKSVSASLLMVAICLLFIFVCEPSRTSDDNHAPAQSLSNETRFWLLKQARARLGGKAIDLQSAPREAKASRRTALFITTFTRGQASRPTMGTGDTLATALQAALEGKLSTARTNQSSNIASSSDRTDKSSSAAPERIQIDILDGNRAPLDKPSPDERDTKVSAAQWIKAGEEGIAFEREGRIVYLLPSELIYRAIFDAEADKQQAEDLLDRAATYLSFARADWQSKSVKLSRFRTMAFVEDSTHRTALDVIAAVVPTQAINRARLLESARAGGDYLVRVQRPNGSFYYSYNPREDRFSQRQYNILRHAGATLALLQLHKATHDTHYLDAARRAVNYLKTRFRPAQESASVYVLDNDDKAKLGANGLALIVLATQIELDRKSADRESAVRLANLILAMQHEDGSFASYYRLRGDEPEGSVSLYYPGEAILGLIELYRLNSDRRLLEAARRGAKYLIASQSKMTELPPDAWLMQALEALYRIDQDAYYAQHAFALADAMIAEQYTEQDVAPFAGAFRSGAPRATPAASRAEGCARRAHRQCFEVERALSTLAAVRR